MQMLMGDAQGLQTRYGLGQVPTHEATETLAPISSAQMTRFVNGFKNRMRQQDHVDARNSTRTEDFMMDFMSVKIDVGPKQKSGLPISTKC